jgi:hypothetical protein
VFVGRDRVVRISLRSGGSNPGGGEIFSTRPEFHPASYTMGTGSFPRVKRPGRGVDHPPPSSADDKE